MIEYGGPLLYHSAEDQQRSFDSTCRKFRRFSQRDGSLTLAVTHEFLRRGVFFDARQT